MLTEIVNGQVVQLSAADETAVRASWTAADTARAQANLTTYLTKRNAALASEVGQLMTFLFNDIAAGTALNAGTFYSAIQTINKQFPQPTVSGINASIEE